MLSNEELSAIKALDLAPEVEEEIISLEEKHREVLFTRGPRTDERKDHPMAANLADIGEQIDEDINNVPVSQRFLTSKEELIPWHVQFS